VRAVVTGSGRWKLGVGLLVAAVAAAVSLTIIGPGLGGLLGRSDSPSSTADPLPDEQWPDATNTGVEGCPPLTPVEGPEVRIEKDGTVYENMEVSNAIIRVLAQDVTIRCVKIIGSGYFGIDNTDAANPESGRPGLTVDRVEIDCRTPQVGMLVKEATVTRANIYGCGDGIRIGGNHVEIKDSYCHSPYNADANVHSDCIQNTGGNTGILIQHNALWGWDTSNILLGLESGEARDVVIDNNRLMSDPDRDPAPAFLIYVSGSNTKITNNRFTRRFTYGPCTLISDASKFTWSGNVWDDDGTPLEMDRCR
jgi:hypothetical protein